VCVCVCVCVRVHESIELTNIVLRPNHHLLLHDLRPPPLLQRRRLAEVIHGDGRRRVGHGHAPYEERRVHHLARLAGAHEDLVATHGGCEDDERCDEGSCQQN